MNVPRIRPMSTSGTSRPPGCSPRLPLAAHASDPVLEWSRIVTETPAGPPVIATRSTAMASLAMHDALNAIHRRYEPYAVFPPAKHGASPDAAIATATRACSSPPFRRRHWSWNSSTTNSWRRSVPPGFETALHRRWHQVRSRRRSRDPCAATERWLGHAGPAVRRAAAVGVYQPTPGVPAPRFEGWQFVRPFGIRSKSQFRAGDNAVMHVNSLTYARDYNEVKVRGDALVRGALPDSARSNIARFWPGGGADWHTVARDISASRNLDWWQRARLFALVNMAAADTPFRCSTRNTSIASGGRSPRSAGCTTATRRRKRTPSGRRSSSRRRIRITLRPAHRCGHGRGSVAALLPHRLRAAIG